MMSDYDIQLFMMCLQSIHLPSDNVTNVTEQPSSFMDTLAPDQDSSTDDYDSLTYNDEEYERMRTFIHKVTPLICVFGTIGNLLNLIIFTRRFYTGNVNQIERGAIIGLAALAVSDLAFCLLIITGSLIPNHKTLFTKKDFSYVYQVYGLVLQNALMKISTWLTTIACMSRYAAVCYPLWARQFIRLSHIKISVLLSFVLPCLLYIPQLWAHTVHEMHCPNYTFYILSTGHFEENVALHQTFNYVWLILGYILPAAIMMYCNYGLIVSFRQSMNLRYQMRNIHSDSVSTSDSRISYSTGNAHLIVRNGRTEVRQCAGSQAKDRITITLITVVVLYIILISPSEILNFYSTISVPGENNKAYHVALISDVRIWTMFMLNLVGFLVKYLVSTPIPFWFQLITNVLQTINFSVNFLLYSIINVYIRQSIMSGLRAVFCCCTHRAHQEVNKSGQHNLLSAKRSTSSNVTAQTDLALV